MPTIGQLPSLSAVDPADEIPLSHGGTTQSISVGNLLSGLQPAILAPTGTLLGRESLGPGGPETISVGLGLDLVASALAATGADHAGFPIQTILEPSDQAVISSSGSAMLLDLSLLRGLFAAGSNITISPNGTISSAIEITTGDESSISYNIANLPVVTTISASDLVGVSQVGTANSITYQNFLNGLTINEAQTAAAASNSDTTWVAQGSGTMVCQTFSAIWAWIVSNQPSYKYPVVEITSNTTLSGTVHNGRILVCSQPITLTPAFANMGSGFVCSVINLSGANVIFGAGIVSSSGISVLPAGLSCTMRGLTYSGGSFIYASISGGTTSVVQTIPGAVTGLVITAVTSNGASLTWVAPTAGGAVTNYTIQYEVGGGTTWTTANSAVFGTSYSISNLQPSTTYNFVVFAVNPAGSGPLSGVVAGSTAPAAGVIPAQVTGLAANTVTSLTLALAWAAPSVGTAPMTYTINYRPTGTTTWTIYASGVSGTTTIITGLSASTSYDFEVFASNASGVGTSSASISQSTTAPGTTVTAISWSSAPSGSFTHGSNTPIAMNAQITPSTAAVQFGFSTSPTVPPANWTLAGYVNTGLWGAYVGVPATTGTWYAWVEGTNGSLPTVYATPFTVT